MRAIPKAGNPLRTLRLYRKMQAEKLKVLVVGDGYHVQSECLRALTALGHQAVYFANNQADDARAPTARLHRLLAAIEQLRPDFLLSINYVGFDRAGWLVEVLQTIALPTAVWLVDHPLFFGMGYLALPPELITTFVWDPTHLEMLRGLGADNLQPLPLATEPAAFATDDAEARLPPRPLSFVGASLAPLTATWAARLTEKELQLGQQMAGQLLAGRAAQDLSALHRLVPHATAPIDRRCMVAAYANCVGSGRLRAALLSALPQHALHVFGDAAWQKLLPAASCHPGVAYGAALAEVYRHTQVNVNVTILQMPSAVNQRVFDVPMAGGFLLTDNQAQLATLFCVADGPKQEAVSYASAEELRDKARYFLARPEARRAVVTRARARVLAEHTYVHRLALLVAQVRAGHRGLALRRRPCRPPAAAPRTLSEAPKTR